MAEIFPWTLSALGVTGAVLNARRRRACFVFWTIANVGWIISFSSRGLWPEAALFTVYLATSTYGLYKWSAPGV